LQVRRFHAAGGEFIADAIYNELQPPHGSSLTIVDPNDATRRKSIGRDATGEDLLIPIFRAGRRVYDPPPLSVSRNRTGQQLAAFHPGVRRFINPHAYPVGLERSLDDLRTALILEARGLADKPDSSLA
jgi:nicotinate phosphoribosyltransferase